jgi:hypothetical protein
MWNISTPFLLHTEVLASLVFNFFLWEQEKKIHITLRWKLFVITFSCGETLVCPNPSSLHVSLRLQVHILIFIVTFFIVLLSISCWPSSVRRPGTYPCGASFEAVSDFVSCVPGVTMELGCALSDDDCCLLAWEDLRQISLVSSCGHTQISVWNVLPWFTCAFLRLPVRTCSLLYKNPEFY